MKPQLSIITVTFNAEKFLESTIQSVIKQSFKSYEYIIVDGASTDGTVDIIKAYSEHITKWVSEKDKGLYDAMNKGLQMATGEYVIFLNAGDVFYDENTIRSVFEFPKGDVYYGKAVIINEKGQTLRERRLKPPKKLTWKSLRMGMVVCHQSFIVRRTISVSYDTNYKICSDIDWMINVLKKANTIHNTQLVISKFLEGGLSRKNLYRSWKERFYIMVKHYGLFVTMYRHILIFIRVFTNR